MTIKPLPCAVVVRYHCQRCQHTLALHRPKAGLATPLQVFTRPRHPSSETQNPRIRPSWRPGHRQRLPLLRRGSGMIVERGTALAADSAVVLQQ